MMRTLKIDDLSLNDLFKLSSNTSIKCYVVFNVEGMKTRYPLPFFNRFEDFEVWVDSGKLAFRQESVDSETFDVFEAKQIHIYPR